MLEISERLQSLRSLDSISLRWQRQQMLGVCMIHSVAAFERGLRENRYSLEDVDAFAANLIDALCGIVSA